MNTKAELQWWIEFAQKDLGRIKQKTKDKLELELINKLEKYCSIWGTISDTDITIQYGQNNIKFRHEKHLDEYQGAAYSFLLILKKMISDDAGKGTDLYVKRHGFQSDKLEFFVVVERKDESIFVSYPYIRSDFYKQVHFFMSLFLNGTKVEDFKNCEYCGKLFLQVSHDKRFCTRNCAANSAKR
ncbi:MAG: hypothetical protein RBS82_11165 [Syntrophales bacterium]|nr:hypothetical protein [Syntrophales bacterium]